jgi:hypothetical protein
MSLWLEAYGITPILNRPKTPQQNAKVERAQGTSSRWAEIHKALNVEDLRQTLTDVCHFQREKYPVRRLGNISRGQLYQSLHQNPRPFDEVLFDEHKAYCYLAAAVLPRKVSSSGNIMLYSQAISVRKVNAGKVLLVKFDPVAQQWICLYQTGEICKILPESRFNRDNLFNLKCQ